MAKSRRSAAQEADEAKRAANETRQRADQVATSKTAKALARFGYASKGVVYLTIGVLAAQVAAGGSSQTPDRNGAMHAIAAQPFGTGLLGLLLLGLFGYALWNAALALLDLERHGTALTGLLQRLGYAVVAGSYGALGVGALLLVVGSRQNGKDSNASTQSWTARLLTLPFGVALVVIGGLIVLGVAGFLFYRVYRADFRQRLRIEGMPPPAQQAILWLGRVGYAAQAMVFALIGVFLIVAALHHDPRQAKGLDGALQTLAGQPFGQALLILVAVGFMAFGVYSLFEARYRQLG